MQTTVCFVDPELLTGWVGLNVTSLAVPSLISCRLVPVPQARKSICHEWTLKIQLGKQIQHNPEQPLGTFCHTKSTARWNASRSLGP